jgi:ferric-dicitrate binding protein FerR (iron transport regulator)
MISHALTHKFVAVVTTAALLTISARFACAAPLVHRGALTVFGTVEVNGAKAISGGTFFSDSAVVTHEESAVNIMLGGTGQIALSANSTLRLSFSDAGLKGRLDAGEARLATPAGVSVSLETPGGEVVVDGSRPTSFTVTTRNGATEVAATTGLVELISTKGCTLISAHEDGVTGNPQTQQKPGSNRKAMVAWFAVLGGAVAAAIWVVTHNSEPPAAMTFGGTVIIPSR